MEKPIAMKNTIIPIAKAHDLTFGETIYPPASEPSPCLKETPYKVNIAPTVQNNNIHNVKNNQKRKVNFILVCFVK
jgi:hypothetical protein